MPIIILLLLPLLLVVVLFDLDVYNSYNVTMEQHIKQMSVTTSIFVTIHLLYSYCMYFLLIHVKNNVFNHLQYLLDNKDVPFKNPPSFMFLIKEVNQLFTYLTKVSYLLNEERIKLEEKNKELVKLYEENKNLNSLLITSNKLSLQSLAIISNTKKYKNGQSE